MTTHLLFVKLQRNADVEEHEGDERKDGCENSVDGDAIGVVVDVIFHQICVSNHNFSQVDGQIGDAGFVCFHLYFLKCIFFIKAADHCLQNLEVKLDLLRIGPVIDSSIDCN